MHGYEAIANALAQEGVEHVFAVAGEDTMELLAELKANTSVGVVQARRESGAAGMADGYSRITGKPGVCMVTVGPGLTNTATALITASRHRSAVICITSEQSPFNRHLHKGGLDQRQFVAATGAKYLAVAHAETLSEDIHVAFRHVRSRQGPVVLAVPEDILKFELDLEWEYTPDVASPPATQRSHPDPLLIAEAVDVLGKAERPVILMGRGAWESQAESEITALAERTGALLITSLLAKGCLADHPYNVGLAGALAPDSMHELLSQADCVLAVGCSLHPFTTEFGLLFPEAQIIQIDRDPAQIGRLTPVQVGILGDARATVAALTGEMERQRPTRSPGFWSEDVRSLILASRSTDRASYSEAPGRIDPRQLMAEMDRILPKDRIVVIDTGFFMLFPASGVSVPEPSHFVWTADFMSVGLGLYHALGVAVGRPDRHVVVFLGDGGFMMSLEELDTAVRSRIPMTVIIMNDNAYGVEAHLLKDRGKPTDIAMYDNPEFAAVARGLGAVGLTVCRPEDLQAVAAAVGKGDLPLLVDAKIDGWVVPDGWSRLHPVR